MDIQELYANIFPIGGVDDNNRYCNLTGDKINTVQLLEPALAVNEFILTKKDTYDKNNQPYKYAYRIPLISIDSYNIKYTDLTAFKLDYTGFIPALTFEFVDTTNSILSTSVPRDGSIISVYIGGQGDELYYKPIRQDFVLTSIRKIGGGLQNMGGYLKYRVYGKLNVPYGYRKESWCMGESTAQQALFNLAVWTGLGFATNFTNTNTLDVMKWSNTETNTYFDFMEEVAGHACYSPNTFFTAFIDQYNVLNFVECHSLLSHGGNKKDVPAMIYKCFPPEELPKFDPDVDEKTTKNQLPLQDMEDDFHNAHQKLSYYFISNNEFYSGWSNFIEEYHEISNNNASLSDGFIAHARYTDSNVTENWTFKNCDFAIRPVDNLKRNTETQKIETLPEEPTKDSYIPLNLMQMKSSDYVDNLASVDNITSIESFTNFGEVDTSNVFKQYFFAEVQNKYQMKCMKKCGLSVRLQNYNPAITKFSRIWVDIYDKNMISNSEISKSEIQSNDTGTLAEYKLFRNKELLQFDEECDRKDMAGVYNRSLSGWYVVTEIELDYNPKENNINMNLMLNRIEYKPCFKSEYNTAKNSVNKYKEDNNIENILTIN